MINPYLPILKGFITGVSLIMGIGAQNVFVIRQGLLRRHLFLTAILCSLLDAVLIILGVVGFGQIVASCPSLIVLLNYFAVAFLLFYGLLSMRSAFKPKSLESMESGLSSSVKKTVMVLLALTLLNPHVYLDTVILLGSIISQQPAEQRHWFVLGTISASFIWFFAMTYGSRFLAPLLSRATSWRVMDCLVALMMWAIALTLIFSRI